MYIGNDLSRTVNQLNFDVTSLGFVPEQATSLWSFRKLNSLYTGDCIRLTDGTTPVDIGWESEPDGNGVIWINFEDLQTAIDEGKTRVAIWYDQTGTADLTPRSTSSNHMLISLDAAPQSKPAIQFGTSGTNALHDNTNDGSLDDVFEAGGIMAFSAMFDQSATTVSRIWSKGVNKEVKYHDSSTVRFVLPYSTTIGIFYRNDLKLNESKWNTYVIRHDDSDVGNVPGLAVNSSILKPCSVTNVPVGTKTDDSSDKFSIGNREPGLNGSLSGYVSEFIIWKDLF